MIKGVGDFGFCTPNSVFRKYGSKTGKCKTGNCNCLV